METRFMKMAIKTAEQDQIDLPIGAVIVKDGEIIAACQNSQERENDVSAHAEICAIRECSKKLGTWRLEGCEMYITLEPCPMCAWAVMRSRISKLYFGAYDSVYGAFSTLPQLQKMINSPLKIKGGILEEECTKLIKDYFKELR